MKQLYKVNSTINYIYDLIIKNCYWDTTELEKEILSKYETSLDNIHIEYFIY